MEIDAVTAAGIPCSLVACFQEYDLDALDPAQHGHLIIERVLAYDDRRELRWLFARPSEHHGVGTAMGRAAFTLAPLQSMVCAAGSRTANTPKRAATMAILIPVYLRRTEV